MLLKGASIVTVISCYIFAPSKLERVTNGNADKANRPKSRHCKLPVEAIVRIPASGLD